MHREGKLGKLGADSPWLQCRKGSLWWASRIGRRVHLYSGALTEPQQDSELFHVEWNSACKNLLLKAVFFQALVTKGILAHENAQGSFDEEAQSLWRKLKTCSPNFSGWLLWKHSGTIPHSLEIRNHHDNRCNPMTPHHLCRAQGGKESRPPAPAPSLLELPHL